MRVRFEPVYLPAEDRKSCAPVVPSPHTAQLSHISEKIIRAVDRDTTLRSERLEPGSRNHRPYRIRLGPKQ